MQMEAVPAQTYVIKALDVSALSFLGPDSPRPCHVEWINRGTDRNLRRSTVQQLARTFHQENASPSVRHLQAVAGLRAVFVSSKERNDFASRFKAALAAEQAQRQHFVTAIFPSSEVARRAIAPLLNRGIPQDALYLMADASQLTSSCLQVPKGHGTMEVAGATAGGGLLGTMLGVAILSIPGVGAVMATGALAATSLTAVATVSGILGATGGAVAKMVSDFDVDGNTSKYYAEQIRRGLVVLSIDARLCAAGQGDVRQLLINLGGKFPGVPNTVLDEFMTGQ